MKTSKLLAAICTLLLLSGCSQTNPVETKPVEVKKDPKLSDVSETVEQNSREDDQKDKVLSENNNSSSQSPVTSNQPEESKSASNKKDTVIDEESASNEVIKEDQPKENNEVTPTPQKPETPVKEEVEEIVETPVKQTAMAQQVMNQINAYRQEHGLQPLESTSYYQYKADAHALDMATQRALWHADNGECITNHPDPFNAWASSPEHNEILLRENNTQGVVSIYYVDGYYYSVFRTAW